MHLVRLENAFGDSLLVAEYDVRDVFDFSSVADAYGRGWRLSVRLVDAPDHVLPMIVGLLEGMTAADGGEMWEIEDSVLLVAPPDIQGPPELPGGGDPSGDRSPLVPVRPLAAGSIELAPPDPPA